MLGIGSIHLGVVVGRHRPHDGGQHCHGVRVVAEALEEIQHALVEHGVRADRVIELVEFALGRQFTVQQQVADFEEIRVLGQLLDRVTPVHEDAFLAVDKRDVGLAAAGCDEAGIISKDALLPVEGGDIDDIRTDRTGMNVQLCFFAVWADQSIGILAHVNPRYTVSLTCRA